MSRFRLALGLMSLCGLVTAAGSPSPVSAGIEFPGPQPGIAKARAEGSDLVLENDALAVRWHVSGGLRLAEAQNKITGETWALDESECFRLVFYESPSPTALTIKGSEMDIVGQPLLRDVPVSLAPGPQSQRYPGKEFVAHLASRDGNIEAEWRASLRDGANYVRQTVALRAKREWVELQDVILIDLPAAQAEVRGQVEGSPVVAGDWFVGFEHPMSKSEVTDPKEMAGATRRIRCSYPSTGPLQPGHDLMYSAIVGVVPKGHLRRGFLYYLERERARPYHPFLHNNVGEDAGHIYSTLSKQDRAEFAKFRLRQNKWWQEVIEDWGREFVRARGVVMDGFVHDYLWDDESKIWQFHEGFQEGFEGPRLAAENYGAKLGVWFTPWGRTGGRGRIESGPGQKFETNFGLGLWEEYGLSLTGPRYFSRFRTACINMVRRYGVSYFKFDGFGAGNNVSGAGPFVSEVEALLQVISELRTLNPDVFINATTGTWPSPFWLLRVDSIWRQGLDVGTCGKGSSRQQWITFRDNETFHNGLVRGPLYPLSSYMLHGIEINLNSTGVGRQRVVGLETKDITDDIRSFFGTGTNCQELYVTPSMMKPEIWDVLAESAKWSRANSDVLLDTHWVGGDPSKNEVYGWASWSSRKGILTLRNPDEQARAITLDIGEVFELPPNAAQRYTLESPWREDERKPAIQLEAGHPHTFKLQPFEVRVFDAAPF
jgi:hypothetical protein